MEEIERRLDEILSAIDGAAVRSGRKAEEITLVAVSKLHPVESMNQVADALRARGRAVIFGENYLQEYAQKHPALTGSYATHLIGPLQSNKVAKAVAEFDLIQSVQSEKVLFLIDKAAGEIGKIMPIFLQVNISADPDKSGFSPRQIPEVVEAIRTRCINIRLQGLMTITELFSEPEMARKDFSQMRNLRDALGARFSGSGNVSDTLALSMGMSADFEIAISEGATHVRIGTAIFGERVTSVKQ